MAYLACGGCCVKQHQRGKERIKVLWTRVLKFMQSIEPHTGGAGALPDDSALVRALTSTNFKSSTPSQARRMPDTLTTPTPRMEATWQHGASDGEVTGDSTLQVCRHINDDSILFYVLVRERYEKTQKERKRRKEAGGSRRIKQIQK